MTINTLFGSKSLKELVTRSTNIVINTKSVETQSENDTEKNPWLVMEDKSPIDDSASVTMIKSDKNEGNQRLILRCKENKTEAYISTSDFMGTSGLGKKKILVRFDNNKAINQTIDMSTNGTALFFRATIKNIKKMLTSNKMVVRYYPYGGGAKTATFDLGNLREEIAPLRDACHW